MIWELPAPGGHFDKPTGVYLQTMTGHEVIERLKVNDILLVPVGSTEQHGPNAPSGEDTFIVTRMCELLAQKTGCTVAHPLPYGWHPHSHLGLPGTIIIPETIFTGMLISMMAGFWNAGFRKMILLNGHGHEFVIPVAIHEFAKTYQVPAVIVNVNWFQVVPEHFARTIKEGGRYEDPITHADEAETSWAMSVAPELFKQEYAVDVHEEGYLPDGHIDKGGCVLHRPIPWYNHVGLGPIALAGHPVGSLGRPTLADPEKAKPGMEACLDYLVTLIDAIKAKFPPGVLPPIEEQSLRSKEEIEAVIRGPLNGGKSIYSLAYPPAR
jgi:creatinine amidohydrolase/Fe(II)-dependent formamide hydrolase-like protein